tara:strand:- start:850 stop:1494 length:645 start_codon:yes stop_codon:yes gene_type:complete
MKGTSGDEEEKEGASESVDQKMSDISKNIMEKVPNAEVEASKLKINKDKNFKTGYTSTGSDGLPIQNFGNLKDTKGYYSDSLGRATKIVNKPTIPNPFKDKVQTNSYDPLSNKEILGISEKILKKNSNLGEEGYDQIKDRIAMAGGDPSSPKKKDATTLPQKKRKEVKGKTVYQKQAEKEHGKGVTALDIVKKDIEKKHGKGAIMDTKKKKEEK